MFFALLGVMPIPWILCGEVFPMAVKGLFAPITEHSVQHVFSDVTTIEMTFLVEEGNG